MKTQINAGPKTPMKQKIWTALPLVVAVTLNFSAQALEVVVGAAGDLAFSDNHTRTQRTPPELSPHSVWDHGDGVASFQELTKGVEHLFWDSDINFVNVETALAQQKADLQAVKAGKKGEYYSFVSHPNGIKHIIESMNVNLLSFSNNHIFDFGLKGALRTEEAISKIKSQYPFVNATGIQRKGDRIAPIEFYHEGHKIAFAAINGTNSGNNTGGERYLVNIQTDDYRTLIQAFKSSDASLKILSIHYGTEGQVVLNQGQRDRYRYAVDHGGVNLILGHHPHVVRPVEVYKGSVIFYSLGNFMITGAANIDNKSDHYRNYGLFGKAYFNLTPGRAELTAVEATPLKGMHWKTYVPNLQTSTTNLRYLNKLNQDEMGATGVQFNITSEGIGVYCTGAHVGPRAQRVCRR